MIDNNPFSERKRIVTRHIESQIKLGIILKGKIRLSRKKAPKFIKEGSMKPSKLGCCLCIFLFLLSINILAEYIEGIDTTDENGYGPDSSFQIIHGRIVGPKIYCYYKMGAAAPRGSFNYVFDEINIVPDSLISIPDGKSFLYDALGPSFAITNSKKKTVSKIIFLERLGDIGDSIYTFKYGTNTEQNGKLLIGSDYDRSIRYKPNNLFNRVDYLSWEPPLPNDNHLQGYIVYLQKEEVTIDTAAPINPAQWDSVGFTDSAAFYFNNNNFIPGAFFNIVAVYTEGKSDFLKGWTRLYKPDHVRRVENSFSDSDFFTSIVKHREGLFEFNFSTTVINLAIFDLTGRRLARFSDLSGSRILWNTSQQGIPVGLYLLRAEFPDRSVVTQPFTVTR